MIRSADMLNGLLDMLSRKLPQYEFYPGLSAEESDICVGVIKHVLRKVEPVGAKTCQVTERYVVTCYPAQATGNRQGMIDLTTMQFEIMKLFHSWKFEIAGRRLTAAVFSQASEEEDALEINLEFVFTDEEDEREEEVYDLMQEIHTAINYTCNTNRPDPPGPESRVVTFHIKNHSGYLVMYTVLNAGGTEMINPGKEAQLSLQIGDQVRLVIAQSVAINDHQGITLTSDNGSYLVEIVSPEAEITLV